MIGYLPLTILFKVQRSPLQPPAKQPFKVQAVGRIAVMKLLALYRLQLTLREVTTLNHNGLEWMTNISGAREDCRQAPAPQPKLGPRSVKKSTPLIKAAVAEGVIERRWGCKGELAKGNRFRRPVGESLEEVQ
jgi:hypothetical protein